MIEGIELQQATLRRDGELVMLVLDHDKGRSIYYLVGGNWRPVDEASYGAMRDLLKDLP